MAWSPDGHGVAGTDGHVTVLVLNAATFEQVAAMRPRGTQSSECSALACSPDNRVFAAGSYGTVTLFDAPGTNEPVTLHAADVHPGAPHSINAVAFSPDAKQVAAGSTDQTVKVWKAATGQEIRTLRGHKEPVADVAWSPDGTRRFTSRTSGTRTKSSDGIGASRRLRFSNPDKGFSFGAPAKESHVRSQRKGITAQSVPI
jgi:WD40 repeat protein